MRVKMRYAACGPNLNLAAGQECEVDDATGKAFVEGGYAEDLSGKVKAKKHPGILENPEGADDSKKKTK